MIRGILQDLKGVLFGIHQHSEGVLYDTSRAMSQQGNKGNNKYNNGISDNSGNQYNFLQQ
jgi:hypothetical protein